MHVKASAHKMDLVSKECSPGIRDNGSLKRVTWTRKKREHETVVWLAVPIDGVERCAKGLSLGRLLRTSAMVEINPSEAVSVNLLKSGAANVGSRFTTGHFIHRAPRACREDHRDAHRVSARCSPPLSSSCNAGEINEAPLASCVESRRRRG